MKIAIMEIDDIVLDKPIIITFDDPKNWKAIESGKEYYFRVDDGFCTCKDFVLEYDCIHYKAIGSLLKAIRTVFSVFDETVHRKGKLKLEQKS